ncbi:unnamed protein product [Closterium sp. NIES-64]|nr:unnamed protein product [Closterium sp. NIES-64]
MSEAAPAAASDPPTSIASPASLPAEAIRPRAPILQGARLLAAHAAPLCTAPTPQYRSPSLTAPLSHLSPCFPLTPLRISLRHKPQLRDRLFAAAVGGAFMHGAWLSHRLYNAESYTQAHNR